MEEAKGRWRERTSTAWLATCHHHMVAFLKILKSQHRRSIELSSHFYCCHFNHMILDFNIMTSMSEFHNHGVQLLPDSVQVVKVLTGKFRVTILHQPINSVTFLFFHTPLLHHRLNKQTFTSGKRHSSSCILFGGSETNLGSVRHFHFSILVTVLSLHIFDLIYILSLNSFCQSIRGSNQCQIGKASDFIQPTFR